MDNTDFDLSDNQKEVLLCAGEMLLGVEREKLGEDFLSETNSYIVSLNDFLQDDISRLLKLFNSRLLSFTLTFSATPFTKMKEDSKIKYFRKWQDSKLGILRTGAVTLRGLVGWGYYSLENSWEDIDYPGMPLGREDKTPTLLEGKHPWQDKLNETMEETK